MQGGERSLCTQAIIIQRSVHGKARKTQLCNTPIAVSGIDRSGYLIIEAVIHVQVRLTSAGPSKMQLTLHATHRAPHGASHVVHAISAGPTCSVLAL